MLDSIRSFFSRRMSVEATARGSDAPGTAGPASRGGAKSAGAPDPERERLQVAAAALLLELVYADDEFTDDERTHLESSLRHHFDLDKGTVGELIELAERERASAVDLYQFTSLIRSGYDLGQKTVLAEVMWGLVLADGRIADHESYVLRRIAKLLDLKPGYLAEARRSADAHRDESGA